MESKVYVWKRPVRSNFPAIHCKFNATPRKEQEVILKEMKDGLNKNGVIMVSAYPGFGKTFCSISMACTIRLPTLVIINKLVLMKQWEESINLFCPTAKVLIVKPKTTMVPGYDFYIINAQNIEKRESSVSHIGTVIVDEAHLIMAKTLSRSLYHLFPEIFNRINSHTV